MLTISNKSNPNYRHIVVEDSVLKNLTFGFAEQERGAESSLHLENVPGNSIAQL